MSMIACLLGATFSLGCVLRELTKYITTFIRALLTPKSPLGRKAPRGREPIDEPPCEDTVRKYMIRPKNPREKSTTWLPFLRNHLDVSWAMDFFTVVTANFAFLYVFLVFQHGRRKVIHLATTYSPSMEWVIQQLREATPFGHQPR